MRNCTSSTDPTSVFWLSSRVTPGAVLIAVVSKFGTVDMGDGRWVERRSPERATSIRFGVLRANFS